MSDYPGGNKTSDHCTYQEMVDRFWWEIRRAIRLDWATDVIESYRSNLDAFLRDFIDMRPGETIAQFKARRIA